jgi:hypothetical protein
MEVLPPCGTSGTPAAAQSRTASASSAASAPVEAAPISEVRRQVRRRGQQAGRAEQGLEAVEEADRAGLVVGHGA